MTVNSQIPAEAPRVTGRPTRQRADQRREALLACAIEMFAAHGFELTTLDAIAAAANTTKRTIYRRYRDKETFFKDCVKCAVRDHFLQINWQPGGHTGDIFEDLVNIARSTAAQTLSEDGRAIRKLVERESARFPEIERYWDDYASPLLIRTADIIARFAPAQAAATDSPEMLARFFHSLAAAPPRMRILGNTMSDETMDKMLVIAARIFLDGLRACDRTQAAAPADGWGEYSLADDNRRLKLLLAEAMLENARLKAL
jgi:TetR/AcrR family transcriptional repressor of mexJK operon